ncbi:hypothetical protein [Cohnella sp.]|uniref:hypothetical protein n=1 Tax=Cohnella sp. TaxID=1883426 RepID=UPI00356812BC
MSALKIVILFVLGLIIGTSLVYLDIELSLFTVFIIIFVISMIFYYSYYFYIMFFTKNVNVVDKFINKKNKHSYYLLLIAIVEKKYDDAERYMKKLGSVYNQTKIAIHASIQLEKKNLEEAEETILKIKNHNIRNHNLALLALLQGRWELFKKNKNQVKHAGMKYALMAEAAFIRKESVEAEKFGELAISSSAGLQKWLLVKSLEHQRNTKDRQFFF